MSAPDRRAYRHILAALGLVVLGGLAFLAVRALLVPASYGRFGNYRADALAEIRSLPVVMQTVETCRRCHAEITALHDKDVHYGVPCVDCHGPGDRHVAFHAAAESGAAVPDEARMPREFTFEGCLFCHRKLNARPSDFPQVDPAEHFRLVGVVDTGVRCVDCHNPHEPIFLATEVSRARLHPVVRKCRECHETRPEGDPRAVEGHPTIFVCADCHRAVVDDFGRRPHGRSGIECSTCHLFHRENEAAQRIFTVGNVRFCLLCHERKPFKDPDRPPKIDWPLHLRNVGKDFDPRERLCIDCHEDQVHRMHLAVRSGGA